MHLPHAASHEVKPFVDQGHVAEAHGIEYMNVPIVPPKLEDAHLDAALAAIDAAKRSVCGHRFVFVSLSGERGSFAALRGQLVMHTVKSLSSMLTLADTTMT
jgi:protein tyrosine phosphatase (PTP) superfamily phosphohydrolase (DUF442 family)